MCRLLAYASSEPSTFPAVVGSSFQEFVDLSSIHCDGWGIAIDGSHIERETTTAKDSAALPTILDTNASTGALLHLRWASPGIPVDVANNHPFTFGGYSFIHNGSLHPYDALDAVLTGRFEDEIKSGSDSHRYFMLLMQNIEKVGLIEGIKQSIADIRAVATYASLNAMLLNDDYLVVINEHDINNRPSIVGEDYYDLYYKNDGKSVVIGSSGWSQEGWVFLPNHTLMIINRKDLSVNLLDLQ